MDDESQVQRLRRDNASGRACPASDEGLASQDNITDHDEFQRIADGRRFRGDHVYEPEFHSGSISKWQSRWLTVDGNGQQCGNDSSQDRPAPADGPALFGRHVHSRQKRALPNRLAVGLDRVRQFGDGVRTEIPLPIHDIRLERYEIVPRPPGFGEKRER